MDKDDQFDLSALNQLSKLADSMKDAYSEGMTAINEAGAIAREDIDPDHEVLLEMHLSASIDGHKYAVNTKLVFELELEPVLSMGDNPMSQILSVLGGAGVDLGEDQDAVMEQLGMPRVIGVVKEIGETCLTITDTNGPIAAELNRDATILATVKEDKIQFNCEGVFTYPKYPNAYIAIPSMAKMQKHMVIDRSDLFSPVEFSWKESDKDNLKVAGTIQLKELDD